MFAYLIADVAMQRTHRKQECRELDDQT